MALLLTLFIIVFVATIEMIHEWMLVSMCAQMFEATCFCSGSHYVWYLSSFYLSTKTQRSGRMDSI